MKGIFVSIVAGAFFGSLYFVHIHVPYIGPILWMFMLWCFYVIYLQAQARKQIYEASQRIEPLFIVGKHPETDEQIYTLPNKLDALCIHTPYRRVMAAAQRQIEILTQSGNGFMLQPHEADRLPVITIFPFDGENVNETWEEYALRATDTIRQVRAQWHGRLQTAREFYLTHHHKQVQA